MIIRFFVAIVATVVVQSTFADASLYCQSVAKNELLNSEKRRLIEEHNARIAKNFKDETEIRMKYLREELAMGGATNADRRRLRALLASDLRAQAALSEIIPVPTEEESAARQNDLKERLRILYRRCVKEDQEKPQQENNSQQ